MCSSDLLIPANGQGQIYVVFTTTNTALQAVLSQYNLGQSGRLVWHANQNVLTGLQTNGQFNPFIQGITGGGAPGDSTLINSFPYTSPSLVEFTNVGGTEAAKVYQNGTEKDSFTLSLVYTGANTALGSRFATSSDNPFNGQIAELLIYDAGATTAQRQKSEAWLAWKYGLTLDASNPYQTPNVYNGQSVIGFNFQAQDFILIPEPSTVLLFLSGAGLLWWWRRAVGGA